MSRSETRLAIGIAAAAVGTGFAVYGAIKSARDERERQAAIEAIIAQVNASYPRTLASRLVAAFASSGYDTAFDFDAFVEKWYENKLYKFLFYRLGEYFADIALEKKKKLASFDMDVPLAELLELSLRHANFDGCTADDLVEEFGALLKEEDPRVEDQAISSPREVLDPLLVAERVKAKRENLLPRSNVFVTDTGPVMITDDFRCVQIKGNEIVIFSDLSEYQRANPQNKKWQIMYDENVKMQLVGNKLDEVAFQLYGSSAN